MRIISRRTLIEFSRSLESRKDQSAVKDALDAWFSEANSAHWKTASDIKQSYASASIINSERVVFNIKGNHYRLVVAIDFEKSIIWIKWIGSHENYDKIDVAKVQHD